MELGCHVFFIIFSLEENDLIIFNCEYCGKEVKAYKSQKSKYCCLDCCYKDRVKKNNSNKIKICEFCGKEYRSKYKDQKFCSRECVNKHQETLIGELSPKYNHTDIKCEICGKIISVKQSKVGKQRFCSNECKEIWYNEYRKTPEKVKEQAVAVIKLLTEGKIKKSMTKPHTIINEMLEQLNIPHINEHNITYYSVDIYLPDSNLMIEIMGDYWHSNPTTKYGSAKNEQQRKRIGKDKAKHSYIRNQYGIEVLYLWEYDIINRVEICKYLILDYIKNKGCLKDYNSFNYNLVNDKLRLNEEIIYPLFAS